MHLSPWAYFIGGIVTMGGLAWAVRSKVFGADELTPADYEEMQIERSGQTLDMIPVGLSESFMGYQYLDLEHTTMVANDSPWGPGVIDHKVLYQNPYDLGYSDETDLMAEANRQTHPMKEYVPKEMSAEAPGQAPYLTSWGAPAAGELKVMHNNEPVSLTPGVGTLNYSPRATYLPKVPPEAYVDFPYMVSLVDAPFVEMPQSVGGENRFGDLSRQSGDSDLNGRFGKLSLDPSVNSGYVDGSGNTKSLEEWTRHYTLLRSSDTMVTAIPLSGGEELRLRRV